jgi:transcriptional regulator with XRE-family HTH domain
VLVAVLLDIKAIRLALGKDQLEMAKKLGISRPWYSLLENGRLKPTDAIKKRMEQVYGKPANELLSPVSLRDAQ